MSMSAWGGHSNKPLEPPSAFISLMCFDGTGKPPHPPKGTTTASEPEQRAERYTIHHLNICAQANTVPTSHCNFSDPWFAADVTDTCPMFFELLPW